MSPASGDRLAFVGDVHLDRDDPDLDAFLEFLERLSERCSRIVLMGDLFNLWIGRLDMELPHQRRVADKLAVLRARGVVVRYLEGNRDYRIAGAYRGTALDDSTDGGLVEEFGGKRIFAIHGDLANPSDKQYRRWRRFSRSGLFWLFFRLLPGGRRQKLVHDLERKMRSTNLEYKQSFPDQEVRDYAAGFLAEGNDAVVLGHFHIEKDLGAEPPSPPGRILVLPEWKEGRRYLEVDSDGQIRFMDG